MEKGVILFDIDGTLLHAPGGRAAFAQAFMEAFGWEQTVEHINFYGATDLNVFRQICRERGAEVSAEMERAFFERLAPALEIRLAVNPPVLFPNVENPHKVFLIGDTPSDINAAKANGFISIAVATGGFDFQTLEKAGADFVFQDLTDTGRVMRVLGCGSV